jgi:DNA (cytosine-5)-methyltransferase 1
MAARDHKSASDLICIPINTMTCQGRPSDDLNPRMGLGIGNVGDPQNTLTKGHSHAVAYVVHGTQDPDVRIEQAHTLGRNNGGENAVAYSLTFCDANGRRSDRPNGGLYVTENPETAPTLTLADSAIKVVSFAENSRAEVRLEGGDGSRTGALSTGGGKAGQGVPCVASAMAVRRLTPTECERLQAFPDGHTLVPYRGKPAADGPRYKALGNSMAVCCMRFIGQRIDAHLTSLPIAKMDATPEQSAGDCYGEVASC